jgi:hypothetical protein
MKKMKLMFMAAGFILVASPASAQTGINTSDITSKNSWLKLGANIGAPVGNAANYSSVVAGLELKGQFMETDHIGIGLTTGYNHFFGKDNFSGFGTIPLGAFVRIYPSAAGFFAGLDGGYSFVTGDGNPKGGAYLRPQLGYHNYHWNFFGYYNNIFRPETNGGSIGSLGIGVTYNVRFK